MMINHKVNNAIVSNIPLIGDDLAKHTDRIYEYMKHDKSRRQSSVYEQFDYLGIGSEYINAFIQKNGGGRCITLNVTQIELCV